jgi:protein-disulfide isomerase
MLMWRAVHLIALVCVLTQSSSASFDSAQPHALPDVVVAELDTSTIRQSELDRRAADDPHIAQDIRFLEGRLFSLRATLLLQMIDERLIAAEAARRGRDVMTLLNDEDAAPAEASDDRRQEIRAERLSRLRHTLRARSLRAIHLPPPSSASVAFNAGPAPTTPGAPPESARILVFGDLYCPACRRLDRVLRHTADLYGDRVRVVYRHFPLERAHPHAREAAVSAWCAESAGRFREFSAALEAQPLSARFDLAKAAKEAGVPPGRYRECIGSEAAAAAIRRDIDDGMRLGVRSTPAVFVDDVPLSGVPSPETLERMVVVSLYQDRRARER